MRIKIIIYICLALLLIDTSFAATLHVEKSSVIMTAGQTIEIPISSDLPIASDLAANGRFQDGDVTFTAGPGCHLSAHGCTLLITAAATSKDYLAEPVIVSEASANNTPVFLLSVIHPGEPLPSIMQLTKMTTMPPPPPIHVIHQNNTVAVAPAITPTDAPVERSGNKLFYAVAEPHPGLGTTLDATTTDFTPFTNGPAYQIITLTNNDVIQPLSVTLSGDGASSFSLDNNITDYGTSQNCAATTNLVTGDSCLIIVKGNVGDPNQEPQKATLNIQGNDGNIATFILTSTTYVYAAGGFNTLGNASVSGGDLLAQCTAGTCSNALQGATGNNYASTNFSVGQWINALSVTPAGNLIVGGVFGAIGGATSGVISIESSPAALLAQCTPGSVAGNSCFNQIGTGIASPYAFNNAYIDAITPPQSTNFIYLGGDFGNIRNFSVSSGGRMLAKCGYSGTSPNQSCSSYLGTGAVSTRFANNAISAVDYLNSKVSVGGLFTQINSYPSSAPLSGTTFATCTTSICSQGMGPNNNPYGSILGMTDDGINLYMGGTFKQIGSYTDSNGGYPLVSCTPATTTDCVNALSSGHDANGYIEGLTYSGGNLYVGGKFTAIGGTTVVDGNMLAVCSTTDGTCSNFITENHPYASGDDWGGEIAAVAIGNQTSISANN